MSKTWSRVSSLPPLSFLTPLPPGSILIFVLIFVPYHLSDEILHHLSLLFQVCSHTFYHTFCDAVLTSLAILMAFMRSLYCFPVLCNLE